MRTLSKHKCIITLTNSGYIKRLPADTYTAQQRGGKGIIGMTTKETDYVENVIALESHSFLLMFTNKGKIHVVKAYRIPEASRTARGTNIVNIVEMLPDEKITALISVDAFNEGEYLLMVTRNGIVKKTALTEYEYQRKGGKIALYLDNDDELVFVNRTQGNSEIVIATNNGNAVRFSESTVRAMGRTARGVKGISLREGDFVKGVAIVDETKDLITVTENGYGKRTPFEHFRTMRNRGGYGVVCHRLTEKTGKLAGLAVASDEDDLMLITDTGTIIRTPVRFISSYSRTAGGVILMRLSEGQKLVNMTKVPNQDSENTEETSATAENQPEIGGFDYEEPEIPEEENESNDL